ncbi:hypothetical protein PO909_029818 [Leuciscus waleckii]
MLLPSNAAIGELPSYKASITNKNGARARLHNFIFLILCFTGGDDGDVSSQAAPPGDVSPALSRPWPDHTPVLQDKPECASAGRVL